MSTIAAVLKPQSVLEAARKLARCDVKDLAEVVVRRLEGRSMPELPGVVRDEELRSIFVELANSPAAPALQENLRQAVVRLVETIATQAVFENPQVAGDVCFLCASLDVPCSIAPLITMVSRADLALVLLSDGEDLRLRTLRTLVALLAVHRPPRREENLVAVLEGLLGDARYKILSLTALIGLWPEERAEFLKLAPLNADEEARLSLSLQWAGFAQETDLKDRRSTA